MNNNKEASLAMHSAFQLLFRFCATALLYCCVAPAAMAAEPAGGTTPQAGISRDQADAMLLELRAIRKLLENIDKKGLAQAAPQRREPRTATVTIDPDRPAMGSADAPVTVVEFTDYQCPFCRRFTQSTFPLIQKQYIDTGKVRWVVRDLPLAFHANARKAGQSVHCADEQGKFWEMRDMLFKNSANLTDEDLKKYAGEVGLDVAAFDACLGSDRFLAEMDKDSAEAKQVSITGTPTFVIGKPGGDKLSGALVVGAQPLTTFQTAIDKLLPQGTQEQEQEQPAGTGTP
jgi:protein-disulfide isomerase